MFRSSVERFQWSSGTPRKQTAYIESFPMEAHFCHGIKKENQIVIATF